MVFGVCMVYNGCGDGTELKTSVTQHSTQKTCMEAARQQLRTRLHDSCEQNRNQPPFSLCSFSRVSKQLTDSHYPTDLASIYSTSSQLKVGYFEEEE